ncbi:MAG TPA: LCP family protein [Streptosporangiaceae bacterium]
MSRYRTRRSRDSRRYSLGMLLAGWTAIGVTAVLVAGTLYGYVKYRNVLDGINHVTLSGLGKRPPQYKNALNILLIGSDSRSGKNAKIGGYTPGQRSDTVMVVHVSPGRSRLTVVSFPRDSVVPILSCPAEPGFGGQTAQSGIEQLNSTFAFGGPNCLLKTLEQETGIRLNDFIQLNFTGFISVIDAIHGVTVCVPYAIHKSYWDKLSLTAGSHVLNGYQALEYWRLREGIGQQSDLQRIQRDQLLMVSLVQKILKSHVLNSLSKTWGIISDIVKARALTTDTGLTPSTILHIATSLSGVSRKSIQFIRVPVITYAANPNWVQWDPTQSPALFAAIEHDAKLPKISKTKKSKKGAKGSKGQPPKLLSASKVNVQVLNGSGVNGIAGQTATALTGRGFHVLGTGGATTSTGAPDYTYTKSVVQYSSAADKAAALTVAAQLTNVTLQQVSTVPAGSVNLILGKDFTTLANPNSQPTGNLANQFQGYTGGQNVCKVNSSAFAP